MKRTPLKSSAKSGAKSKDKPAAAAPAMTLSKAYNAYKAIIEDYRNGALDYAAAFAKLEALALACKTAGIPIKVDPAILASIIQDPQSDTDASSYYEESEIVDDDSGDEDDAR